MSRKRNSYRTGDRFNAKAKDEGFRARSVYKLTEIQKRLRPLSSGDRVLDLGCAPGSWSKYARQVVGKNGVVVGVDLQAVDPLPGVSLLQGDAFETDPDVLRELLGGPANVVISDMAPATTGDRFGDHVRQIELTRRALHLATVISGPGGNFVCKVFEGEDANDFVSEVKALYGKVKRVRPEAVRRQSVEFFVVGLGLHPP